MITLHSWRIQCMSFTLLLFIYIIQSKWRVLWPNHSLRRSSNQLRTTQFLVSVIKLTQSHGSLPKYQTFFPVWSVNFICVVFGKRVPCTIGVFCTYTYMFLCSQDVTYKQAVTYKMSPFVVKWGTAITSKITRFKLARYLNISLTLTQNCWSNNAMKIVIGFVYWKCAPCEKGS